MAVTIEDPTEANIFDTAVCVEVKLSKLGVRRKVGRNRVAVLKSNTIATDPASIDAGTDKSLLHVGKDILTSPTLKKIGTIHGKIRSYLSEMALPARTMFGRGIYPIPIPLVAQVDARLEEFFAELQAAVDAFIDEYPALVETAPARLSTLFNPRDYPPVSAVKRAFDMSKRYVNMGVPGALEGISQSIFARETANAATAVAEAADEVKAAMRVGLKELVDHLFDRLTPAGDGDKPKKFHYTTVANLTQFLTLFEAKNIAKDGELAALVSQAKQLLNGVDPQKLRENTDLRDYVQKGMGEIKATLDTMIVTGGGRRILDDDADDDEDEEDVTPTSAWTTDADANAA